MPRSTRAAWSLLAALVSSTAFAAGVPGQKADPPSAATKRVEIDKTKQLLRAFEGDRVILETPVSTGKWDRSTPSGEFRALGKERMHYSRKYHNAPMPFSVHITGHVFIHGYKEVPPYPASHGCIRVPLDRGNPAKKFYEWVEVGTPVHVFGRWEK